jgi:hypothetical protein
VGFFEGRAAELQRLQTFDTFNRPARGGRRAAAPTADEDININYHRLSARAWEAVAKKLVQSQGVSLSDEDLRRAYLSVRREIYQSGQVEGRGFDGKAKPSLPVGPLHEDVEPFVLDPKKW